MWRCTKCSEQNEDQFLTCWKCQERKPGKTAEEAAGPEDSHLDLIVDPERPVPIGEGNHVACPTCGLNFKVQRDKQTRQINRRLETALCPFCSNPITPELLVRVTSKPREGSNKVNEVLYACPYCGKIVGITETSK